MLYVFEREIDRTHSTKRDDVNTELHGCITYLVSIIFTLGSGQKGESVEVLSEGGAKGA